MIKWTNGRRSNIHLLMLGVILDCGLRATTIALFGTITTSETPYPSCHKFGNLPYCIIWMEILRNTTFVSTLTSLVNIIFIDTT
ncbi:hypothetical protein GGI42DRAFT_314689 [Trichoderma sp. SZMC 28013]